MRHKRSVLLCLLLVVAACGMTKDALVAKTFIGVNAARDAFTAWDGRHQTEIVDAAKTEAEGRAELTAYRAERARVQVAFVAAYSAIAVASLDDSADSAIQVVTTGASLLAALKAAKVIQ